MTRPLRIGTRGSALALWQANEVRSKLAEAGYQSEVVVISTTGDRRAEVSLAEIGGKGLWIKELEEALDRLEVDLAVHSLKDVPSIEPEQFVLAGFLQRADPRDAWVQIEGKRIDELPAGSRIATSAPRRRAQLRERYPSLRMEPIRGNVDTRLGKLRKHQYEGAVLAGAGLIRLGRQSEITSFFAIDEMVPAAGQGIIVVETRQDDRTAKTAAGSIDHPASALAARSERGVLQKFGTRLDCQSAVAVHATFEDDRITIRAFFGEIDGDRVVRCAGSGHHPEEVMQSVYESLVRDGALALLTPLATAAVEQFLE